MFCEKPCPPTPPRRSRRSPGSSTTARCRSRSAIRAASTRHSLPPGRPSRVGELAGYTPSGPPPWTRHRPPAAYIEVSGGIFRDCSVHDFDTVRWVTGREVVEVYATGSRPRRSDSSPSSATSLPPQPCSPSTTAHRGGVQHPVQRARATTCGWSCTARPTASRPVWMTSSRSGHLEPGVELPGGQAPPVFMDRLAAAFRDRAPGVHRGRCRTDRRPAPSTTRWRRPGSPKPQRCRWPSTDPSVLEEARERLS